MRFPDNANPAVRFRAVIFPTVRFGVVLRYRKYYGAVWYCDTSYRAVRRGSPSSVFSLVRFQYPWENRTAPLFLYGAPYVKTVQNRGFVRFSSFSPGINETAVSPQLLYGAPYE